MKHWDGMTHARIVYTMHVRGATESSDLEVNNEKTVTLDQLYNNTFSK